MSDTPLLSNADIIELTEWRRHLHQYPELSGEEEMTANTVIKMLKETHPDRIITNLGGHGVAAIYDSGQEGPRVLLRCELDGLPIEDLADVPHKSKVTGKGHQCGHDGHMAMLAAMARILGRKRPKIGAVILMFQPAEEDGSGARKVVDDPHFNELKPDYSFAIHNMPGLPFGQVNVVAGPMCCASRGVIIKLKGRTAHASQPETGISPMNALANLMLEISNMSSSMGTSTNDPAFTLVTITHVNMGAPVFGVAPSDAELFATLRTLNDDGMKRLVERVEASALKAAQDNDLKLTIEYQDVFVTCSNDEEATSTILTSLDNIGIRHTATNLPIRASEDFGHFGKNSKMALMFVGSGENLPALHNPDFDFPDDLILVGAKIYTALCNQILKTN